MDALLIALGSSAFLTIVLERKHHVNESLLRVLMTEGPWRLPVLHQRDAVRSLEWGDPSGCYLYLWLLWILLLWVSH